MQKTVCELFAGVGGFRLGLETSSPEWQTVWFNQWEPNKRIQHAYNCYVNHFQNIDARQDTNMDIHQVPKNLIPNHNLLVGGFPCQDYSVARTLSGSTGIEGKKGVLWWDIRDILEEKQPSFLILENVDRLLKSPSKQRGRDFGIILACLNELGYSVEWRVINAAEYGAAQRRRRTFIFAYKNTLQYSIQLAQYTNDQVITQYGLLCQSFPISTHANSHAITMRYNNIADISETFSFPFENAGYMRNGVITTTTVSPVIITPETLGTKLQQNVAENFYITEEKFQKWIYLKGRKSINRISKSGHPYKFSEGPIAYPDPLDKPSRTMLTSESSLNRSSHVVCDPQTNRLRLITPVEAERLQGFPDNWTDTGMPQKFRYFCMGNALVVPMITRMANVLNPIIEAEP